VAGQARSERLYGGKTAEQRRAERHEKLLDAAVELFGTVGFAATTIEMLCHEAGLHPRYFYEQFDTREALLMAVYDRHVETVLAEVVATLDDAPNDPRVRLERGLRTFVDAVLADERLARINYFEMIGVSRELEARRRAVLRAYADMITAQLDAFDPDQRLTVSDPRLGAVALVGAVDGLIINALANDSPREEREAIIMTLLELFGPPEHR
jgi:AcrR family transcriptional regulator